MTQSIRFQDIVQHPSSLIRGVEIFGSFNSKKYTPIKTQGRSLILIESPLMSPFARRALIASQIAFFPLTLIALIFKAVWRSFHSLQIEAFKSDKEKLPVRPLPTSSVTDLHHRLNKRDPNAEPSNKRRVLPLSNLALGKNLGDIEESISNDSSPLPNEQLSLPELNNFYLSADGSNKPFPYMFNYKPALIALNKPLHIEEFFSSWPTYKLLTTQFTAFPSIEKLLKGINLSLSKYLPDFTLGKEELALFLFQDSTPSIPKLLTDQEKDPASARSNVPTTALSASEKSLVLSPISSSAPQKPQNAVLSLDLQKLPAPLRQQIESILNSPEALQDYLNHPPRWLKQLLHSPQIQDCQNLCLAFFNGAHSQLITINLQSQAPSGKAFPFLVPAPSDDEMTLAHQLSTSMIRHQISQQHPLPSTAFTLQNVAHNRGAFPSKAPTSQVTTFPSLKNLPEAFNFSFRKDLGGFTFGNNELVLLVVKDNTLSIPTQLPTFFSWRTVMEAYLASSTLKTEMALAARQDYQLFPQSTKPKKAPNSWFMDMVFGRLKLTPSDSLEVPSPKKKSIDYSSIIKLTGSTNNEATNTMFGVKFWG